MTSDAQPQYPQPQPAQQPQQHQSDGKGKNTMYEQPLSPSSHPFALPPKRTVNSVNPWSHLGSWAIPSSVLPPKRKAFSLSQGFNIPAHLNRASEVTLEPDPFSTRGSNCVPQSLRSRRKLPNDEHFSLDKLNNPRKSYVEHLEGFDTEYSRPFCSTAMYVSDSTHTTGFVLDMSLSIFYISLYKKFKRRAMH